MCQAMDFNYPFLSLCGNDRQAAEQGAAPDRLQLRSFLTPLPAAGELVVVPLPLFV